MADGTMAAVEGGVDNIETQAPLHVELSWVKVEADDGLGVGTMAASESGDDTIETQAPLHVELSWVEVEAAGGPADAIGTLDAVEAASDTFSAAGGVGYAVNFTGVAASPALGVFSVVAGYGVSLTGVAASPAVGAFQPTGGIATVLEGVAADPGVGELAVSIPLDVLLTGVRATPRIGTFTVYAVSSVVLELTGVAASPGVGTFTVWGKKKPPKRPPWGTALAGDTEEGPWVPVDTSNDATW